MRALSIRQPYVEMILRGLKTEEYRSRRTHVRERIWIYASKIPGNPEFCSQLGVCLEELPTGLLVGTVEIVDCTSTPAGFAWHLRDPRRLARQRVPRQKPQPIFFYPFGRPEAYNNSGA